MPTPTPEQTEQTEQPEQPPQADPAPQDPTPPESPTPEELQRALTAARREAGRERAAREKAEAAVKEREEAELTEVERLRKELAERDERDAVRDREAQATTVRLEAMAAAVELGYRRPGRADREIEWDAIEWEDGKPTNLRSLLSAEAGTRPELLGSFSEPPDLGQGRAEGKRSTLSVDEIRKMTPEQMDENWPEIREVLRQRGRVAGTRVDGEPDRRFRPS